MAAAAPTQALAHAECQRKHWRTRRHTAAHLDVGVKLSNDLVVRVELAIDLAGDVVQLPRRGVHVVQNLVLLSQDLGLAVPILQQRRVRDRGRRRQQRLTAAVTPCSRVQRLVTVVLALTVVVVVVVVVVVGAADAGSHSPGISAPANTKRARSNLCIVNTKRARSNQDANRFGAQGSSWEWKPWQLAPDGTNRLAAMPLLAAAASLPSRQQAAHPAGAGQQARTERAATIFRFLGLDLFTIQRRILVEPQQPSPALLWSLVADRNTTPSTRVIEYYYSTRLPYGEIFGTRTRVLVEYYLVRVQLTTGKGREECRSYVRFTGDFRRH